LSLKELDLNLLNFSVASNSTQLNAISLANAKVNVSFELFLSNLTKSVDFSENKFIDFKIFEALGDSMETLILRNTNMQRIEQIYLNNLVNLKYLDLSFNNLFSLSKDEFEF